MSVVVLYSLCRCPQSMLVSAAYLHAASHRTAWRSARVRLPTVRSCLLPICMLCHTGPRAGRRSTPGAPALVGGVPTGSGRMVLSLPEFECAAGHALCIYGDLDVYVGE